MKKWIKCMAVMGTAGVAALTLAADEPQSWTYYAADDLGPAVSEEAFGGILAGVAASDTAKPVIVYVSEFQPTWLQTGYVSPVDPSEAAYLPAGERVLGVYRAGASAPSGKAWICHRPSPFDPKGTRFIIR